MMIDILMLTVAILGMGLMGFALALTVGLFAIEIATGLISLDGYVELFREKIGW